MVVGSIVGGERVGKAPRSAGRGPAGLSFTERQMLHTPQLHLCVVTSDQRSYSMQCIYFRYRNIEKIFIEI